MTVTLSLDAMGGDNAPSMTMIGANLALEKYPDLTYVIFGNSDAKAIWQSLHPLCDRSEFTITEDVVSNNEKPSIALRSGRNSSMRKAIDAVKLGKADAVVSAGNTGAYMAMSKFVFNTLSGIDRPALPAVVPSLKEDVLALDFGANLESSVASLVQNAVMGEALYAALTGKKLPSVGILNIGEEEQKGKPELKETASILKELHDFNFYGFVEGDDLSKGTVDVVVTDGFTGNVTLKTIEGTAKLITGMLRESISNSLLGKIGAIIAKRAFADLRRKSDPRHYNGAVFLGLRQLAVKSHGGTDEYGFCNAICVAMKMLNQNFMEHIQSRINNLILNKTPNKNEIDGLNNQSKSGVSV